ncbi:MAG: SUMF1/EgtB/PvdO family nonheme iron enzyme [Polyangiaceae bacterium]|nr:SUMF1/EgtB/PvdO family nonheme iron enzyme [Polyangiaceae bacterium]
MRGSFAVLVTGFVFLAGCNVLLGTCGLEADLDATSGAGGGAAGAGAGIGDGGGGNGQSKCADVCGTPGCGTCPPLEMVAIPGAIPFQIDAKEVTNAEYQAFVATNPELSPEDDCEDNQSYEQGALAPAALNVEAGEVLADYMVWLDSDEPGDDRPAVFVDWCDANAYCKWAGKRLCDSFDGLVYEVDASEPAAATDPSTSRWFVACTGSPATLYPYGDTLQESWCNYDNSGPDDVGTHPQCEGGYDGLLDMSGNVAEWENGCSQFGNPESWNQNCLARGGTWHLGGPTSCDAFRDVPRYNMSREIGFRCCSIVE